VFGCVCVFVNSGSAVVVQTGDQVQVDLDLTGVAVCCSVLQYVAVCCSLLQFVAVCCSLLHCIAVRQRSKSKNLDLSDFLTSLMNSSLLNFAIKR